MVFGLFAVYSTSIRKSFDQKLTVQVMKNIETIKAFNTFLDETILRPTQLVIHRQKDINIVSMQEIDQKNLTGKIEDNTVLLPILDTLESKDDKDIQLVDQGEKKIKKRSNYILFFSQIRNLVIALFAVFFILFVPIRWLKENKFIYVITIGVVFFQICVFIPGIAATNGEARGWVDFPGLPNMQPAEFFKLGYVFFMSYWLTKKKQIINSEKFLIQFAVVNAFILFIILAIPDFGTLFILALTGAIMAWYSGLKIKKLGILGSIAILVAIIGVSFIGLINPRNYALDRLTTFLERDPEARKEIELREGWQIQQGLVAVGAGGFLGQGYGKGLQKMGQLPEAYSDMIFSAFSEEIGFLGNMILFSLYIGLFFVVLRQIAYVRDPQIKTLAVGIISLIIVQVFVHVGVNLDILPNTGLTLPFVSHGGTALMINLIELTLLYKILKGKDSRISIRNFS